jgi:hypothetical protein
MKKRYGALCLLVVSLAAFVLLSFGGNGPRSAQAQGTPVPAPYPVGDTTPSNANMPVAGPVVGTPSSAEVAHDGFLDIEDLVKQLAIVRQQKEKLAEQEKAIVAEIEKKIEEKKQGLQSLQQQLEKMGIGASTHQRLANPPK